MEHREKRRCRGTGRIKKATGAGRVCYHGLAAQSDVAIFGRCRVLMDNGDVFEAYFCRAEDGLAQTVLPGDLEILGELEVGEVVMGDDWPWGP